MRLNQKYGWITSAAKEAPIGYGSVIALVIVAACCLIFDGLLQLHTAAPGKWIAAFVIPAYLLFPLAVAGCLYSILFESSKRSGLIGLAIAGLTLLPLPSAQLLDGVLLVPFWFLAIMGVVRLVRWRESRRSQLT